MSDPLIEALSRAVGPGRVAADDDARDARRRDEWVLSHLDDADPGVERVRPRCVVRPHSTGEVAAVLRLCSERDVPVVPYGLGSGVSGAFKPGREAVVLDLGAMTAVRALDVGDLVGTFEAGLRGSDAERLVGEHGLTLGHAPQSIALSSLGGWVATRSSGQCSTRYGNIDDMLLGLEVVLADGRVVTSRGAPRSAAGPRLDALFVGSEGTLGVVTAVTLSLRRAPRARRGAAYRPASMREGLALLAELTQRDVAPPVARLYDAAEAARHFPDASGDGPLLVLVHEGDAAVIDAERAIGDDLARSLGVPAADASLATSWLAHRFEAPSFAALVASGLVFDTIEVAARWSTLPALYERVVREVGAVEGVFVCSGHASHAYRSGASLYFTFAGRGETLGARRETWRAAWRAAMRATVEAGATISHHHGVGRTRTPWLADELGASGLWLLGAVQRALDPRGVMNPGALRATGEGP